MNTFASLTLFAMLHFRVFGMENSIETRKVTTQILHRRREITTDENVIVGKAASLSTPDELAQIEKVQQDEFCRRIFGIPRELLQGILNSLDGFRTFFLVGEQEEQDNDGPIAFMYAVGEGAHEVVKKLLEMQALMLMLKIGMGLQLSCMQLERVLMK